MILNDVFFGKGSTSATPTTYAIRGTGGSGTDIAGGGLVLGGGQGTGAASGGSIVLRTAPAGASGAGLNALVDQVTVNSAGNVGVGTTNPGQRLEVNGNIKLTAASGGGIIFQDGTTQTSASFSGTGQMWVRVTRALVASGASDAVKDTACSTEFGAAYSAATHLEFGANAINAVYISFYFNVRTSGVAYNVNSGNLNTFIAGSYPLACIRSGAPIRATTADVATTDTDAVKDAACVAEFGSAYQAANQIDASINWRGPYDPVQSFNVAGNAVNACYTHTTYVGAFCAFAATSLPELCILK
jgi:hypothetical protein